MLGFLLDRNVWVYSIIICTDTACIYVVRRIFVEVILCVSARAWSRGQGYSQRAIALGELKYAQTISAGGHERLVAPF